MFSAAALPAYSCVAVRTRPALQTGLVAVVVTGVVAKELVPWSAELVAAEAVVVLVTADPDLVLELADGAVVSEFLPVGAGIDHPRVGGLFNDLGIRTTGLIVEVQGFHYQSVGPRPGETEPQNYPGSFIPCSALQRKCIPSQDGRRSSSKTTRPSS